MLRPSQCKLLLAALVFAAGCQDPFGADRHDLIGDRVAAIRVAPSGGVTGTRIGASAALCVEGQLWSDEPAALSWLWLDTIEDAATADIADAVATGPQPSLRVPSANAVLGLVAQFPSGFIERSAFALTADATTSPTIPSLGITTRVVADDDVVPLVVPDTFERVRFMSVDGHGTFAETTRSTADLTIAEITLDGEEEVDRQPTPPGPLTVLALGIGAGNAWRAEDLWVGTAPVGAWLDDGRFLPADADLAAGPHEVLLAADDSAPWGLAIAAERPTSGAPALDLDALLTGVQLRAELADTWVTVTVP